jgi:hypothetical protein
MRVAEKLDWKRLNHNRHKQISNDEIYVNFRSAFCGYVSNSVWASAARDQLQMIRGSLRNLN